MKITLQFYVKTYVKNKVFFYLNESEDFHMDSFCCKEHM